MTQWLEPAVKDATREGRLRVLGTFTQMPDNGAWDTSVEVNCAGYEWVVFYWAYQRGGAEGSLNYRVLVSPFSSDQVGVENWYLQSLHSAGTVTPGQEAASQVQREWDNYKAHFGGVECWCVGPIHLGRCVERLVVQAAEYGNQAAPGSAGVYALFNEGG